MYLQNLAAYFVELFFMFIKNNGFYILNEREEERKNIAYVHLYPELLHSLHSYVYLFIDNIV